MISIFESTYLKSPPAEVWRVFAEMERHYQEWHPEHLTWRYLRGSGLTRGAILFADEWVGPLRLAARFFIDEAEPNAYFRFHIGFPFSLVRAGGWFRLVEAPDGGTRLDAETHFGLGLPIIGGLLDPLLRRLLPLGELRRHMREEGEGFASLLPGAQGHGERQPVPV